MNILIIAEHDGNELKSSTLSAITAASQITENIDLVLFSNGDQELLNNAKKTSIVKKVINFKNPKYKNQIAEDISSQLNDFLSKNSFTHIMTPSSTFGKNLLPRVAAFLDVQQISDIIKIHDHETFDRPIYAGNAISRVRSNDKTKVITVRGTCFEKCQLEGDCEIETIEISGSLNEKVNFVKHELSKSDRPELTAAKVVISGGRGMQNGDNFRLLEGIADKLGAAIGASRAAVDAGFVPNDWQVGQTGKIVAPDLYIAVGISGAIQHLAGIKDSKFIVAINKDEEAPIFNFSDYGLVGDLFQVLPELEKKL
tara:strand:+ start:11512 stop:12447 length:936 start_codon:yes stop_codon:yes gene_type:complete